MMKFQTPIKYIQRNGFSLIELLLVLGVVSVLLLASFGLYSKFKAANQASAESKNSIMIMNKMQTVFGQKTANVSTGIANQARVFPANMNGGDYSASASIKSAWGGNVRIITTGAASYDLLYESISPAVCLELLPQLVLNFQWVQIQKGSAGGGGQTWLKNPGHTALKEPTVSELVSACTNNGDSFLVAIGYR